MKTAVSLPDSLYQEAEKTAQSMGIPRSQLFARALEEFIEHHKRENITEKLNTVFSHTNITDKHALDIGIESLRSITKHDTW